MSIYPSAKKHKREIEKQVTQIRYHDHNRFSRRYRSKDAIKITDAKFLHFV
jgi:hypothetical protein